MYLLFLAFQAVHRFILFACSIVLFRSRASNVRSMSRGTMSRNSVGSVFLKLLAAAVALAFSALLVGFFYLNANQEFFPLRQLLLHDERTTHGAIKSELVSFRALQPDGSLEINHIDVDTAVRIDPSELQSKEADAVAVVTKSRTESLRRSGRRLHDKGDDDDDDDDSSEELAFSRKVWVGRVFIFVPKLQCYSSVLHCNSQLRSSFLLLRRQFQLRSS